MSKVIKAIYEEIFKKPADEQLEVFDLETFETENVVNYLRNLLREAEEILDTQKAEDDDNE